MQQRVKYPLTPEAKEAARQLVEAWDNDKVKQTFYLNDMTAGGDTDIYLGPTLGTEEGFASPSMGILGEFAEYKLIRLDRRFTKNSQQFEVTLLQELRSAVENDFDVSDFFLTTSAVGTIIYGNLTLDKHAVFQSAAAGIGDVTLTAETLPDEIVRLLGADAVRPDVAQAIEALRNADKPTRQEKIGKLIEELGRGLAHFSNTAGALNAIMLIVKFFGA